MATTKTLTPTNVTISIPEFTDQPDQRVNSNCIDKEADAINALSEHLTTYNVGTFSAKSGLQPALVTFNGTLSDNEIRNIMFAMSSTDGVLLDGIYYGTIKRYSSSRFMLTMQSTAADTWKGSAYYGTYANGSWDWASNYNQIALQINFGDVTKSLTQNLTSHWTTSVPNDTFPRLCIVTSQGGSWFGFINRYSSNYGAGLFTRYDGYSSAVFLNNGTVTTKTLSYQT